MTLAPPRQGMRKPALIETQPIRRPDAGSATVMTRRAWWLVALNFLIPGSAQILAGSRRLGRIGIVATIVMWAVVVLAVVTALLWPTLFYSLANGAVLLVLQLVLLAYAVLWLVLTVDTLRLVRFVKVAGWSKAGAAVVAIAGLVLSSGGAAYAAQSLIGPAREAFAAIFGNSAPSVPPSDGYYNILLLGADSGLGRDSMRFDSISVVSISADTGAVTITGIPRDMQNMPFSEGPMRELYPDGFEGHVSQTCGWAAGVNQLTNAVEVCREDRGTSIYPDAADQGSSPAIEATKDAASGALGLEIPYYVFVDMKGFADIVDALGGVDINVVERLPEGGGPSYDGEPAADWATGWIEAGQQHMDGDTAQWYARSRYTTSDWDRMRRQRELQQAILAQASPANVLMRFQEVAGAGEDLVQTDIPESLLPALTGFAVKAKEQPVTTIELTPEGAGVDPDNPRADDWALILDLMQATLHPTAEEPTS